MASQPTASKVPVAPSPSALPLQKVALPLHVQKLQGALNLDALINQVERAFNESLTTVEKTEKTPRYGFMLMSLCYEVNLLQEPCSEGNRTKGVQFHTCHRGKAMGEGE